MLRRYETLILISPDLTNEENSSIIESLEGIIKDRGGEVITVDDWGIKELAYEVKKHTRGRYVRLEYALPPTEITELERRMRINEDIFKYLTVKLSDKYQSSQGGN